MSVAAIESGKKFVRITYRGFRGYMPMVGHLGENGLVVAEEFRDSYDSPGARNLAILK